MAEHIASVTRSNFASWRQTSRYGVLMVKMRHCGPCFKAYPMYAKLATLFQNSEKGIAFAEHTFDLESITQEDKQWIREELAIQGTPTFIVYDGDERVFAVSSAKRLPELKEFLGKLSLD